MMHDDEGSLPRKKPVSNGVLYSRSLKKHPEALPPMVYMPIATMNMTRNIDQIAAKPNPFASSPSR